jgi:hypothetical protein
VRLYRPLYNTRNDIQILTDNVIQPSKCVQDFSNMR